ncbi:CDGSH iron-sulfur domain-containing protein [Variovorax ureilyticus]|uniref:CDGSH iron-sulfur domain-containing protein n=1 Tax=Variovorax ureilyticus TaxID=1836198 RepID=A0ABU8VAV3_9BURK
MARLVMRTRSKPYPIDIGGETQFICGCGLSANQPFCDGTHKLTRDEQEGTLCWYDADMQRKEIGHAFPNIRAPRE